MEVSVAASKAVGLCYVGMMAPSPILQEQTSKIQLATGKGSTLVYIYVDLPRTLNQDTFSLMMLGIQRQVIDQEMKPGCYISEH